MRRDILGLASGDPHLQSLIPFVSTAESKKFGFSEFVRGRKVASYDRDDLPQSLAELAVDRLQQQGNEAFKLQDLPEAIRRWTDALGRAAELENKSRASRTAQLLANRCQAHLSSGDDVAALADAEAAVAAWPSWPKAYYRHGTCLMRHKLHAQAHAVFLRGLELDSSNPELLKSCQKAQEAMEADGTAATAAPSSSDPAAAPAANPATDSPPSGGGGATRAADSKAADAAAKTMPGGTEAAAAAVDVTEVAAATATTVAAAATVGSAAQPEATAEGEALAKATEELRLRDVDADAKAAALAFKLGSKRAEIEAKVKAARLRQAQQEEERAAASAAAAGGGGGLPLPTHLLQKDPDGGKAYLLSFELPQVSKSGDVDLSISDEAVDVEVPGLYAKCHVALPKHPRVLDDHAKASFDTKRNRLRIYLPHV